jgi:hypothetical protein
LSRFQTRHNHCRRSPDGYTVIRRAGAGEGIHAVRFDAIELRVGVLFGDDDE